MAPTPASQPIAGLQSADLGARRSAAHREVRAEPPQRRTVVALEERPPDRTPSRQRRQQRESEARARSTTATQPTAYRFARTESPRSPASDCRGALDCYDLNAGSPRSPLQTTHSRAPSRETKPAVSRSFVGVSLSGVLQPCSFILSWFLPSNCPSRRRASRHRVRTSVKRATWCPVRSLTRLRPDRSCIRQTLSVA